MQLKPLDEAVPLSNLSIRPEGCVGLIDRSATTTAASLNARTLAFYGLAAARYARELDWLETVPRLGRPASRILAARAVGCMMAMRPGLYGAQHADASILLDLASVHPNWAAVERANAMLPSGAASNPALTAEDMASIDALWPVTAPTEYLLASGGDDRLRLETETGLNKYGCAPWPRPDVVGYGSCTASSPSVGAFEAAERTRRALAAASLAISPATALAEASESISHSILRYFDVQDLAEAVLAASGTDAALVVTGLLAAEHPGEMLTSILVCPSETGSGVPNAVQGRHFASYAPSGSIVGKGEPIDGLPCAPRLETVALRDKNGAPRPAIEIEAEFEVVIRRGIAAGRVVLHAIDGSKTGLSAPDRAACSKLASTYGPRLDIVIDACQARIEPSLVRWYLQNGFPVLITGSKFFSAPGFCGAVLFPRLRLEAITHGRRLPAGLAAYARLRGGFGSRRCTGLVLRWTAALHEMGIFQHVPRDSVAATLERIEDIIVSRLARDRHFWLIDAPRPAGADWSARRSVFTFAVSRPSGRMALGELRRIYQLLSEDCSALIEDGAARCQIGQPVELGGKACAGLRIAISSAQIVSDSDHDEALAIVLGKLRRLVDASSNQAGFAGAPTRP